MQVIKRFALVMYTPLQMFSLVNHISDYPRFLPWCKKTDIIYESDKEIEATIHIAFKGIEKKFTTRNYLFPNNRMEIKLIEGPFKSLMGEWRFIPLGDHGCKVELLLSFEFTGNFMDKMFQPIFNYIANSLVDAFCKRALEVYGH